MRLYNLFEEVIFEQTARLLTESISEQQIIDAIDGKYNVNILYDDFPNETPSVPPSKRYIQIYILGKTKAGNTAIRAYQIGGGSKTTTEGGWKLFRLDRIRGFFPTRVKWKRPISDFSTTIPTFKRDANGVGTDRELPTILHAASVGDYGAYVRDTTRSRELTSTEKAELVASKKPTIVKKTEKKSAYVSKAEPEQKLPIDTSKTTAPVNTNVSANVNKNKNIKQ
jgi:hypothetical protein